MNENGYVQRGLELRQHWYKTRPRSNCLLPDELGFLGEEFASTGQL